MSSNITKLTAKLKALPDQQSRFATDDVQEHLFVEKGALGAIDVTGFTDLMLFFASISEDSYRRGFQHGVVLAEDDSGKGKYTAEDLACEFRHKGHLEFQLLDPRPRHTLHRFMLQGDNLGLRTLFRRYNSERYDYLKEHPEESQQDLEVLSSGGIEKHLDFFANMYLKDRDPELLHQLGLDHLIED